MWDKLLEYLAARASEPSTWVSLGVTITGAGFAIAPDHWQLISSIGLIGGGILGTVLRERRKATTGEIKEMAREVVIDSVKDNAVKESAKG